MQLILGYHRLAGRNLAHLMPLRLRVVPRERLLTTGAHIGFERDHYVHVCYRHQHPGLPRVTGLSTRTPATGLTAGSLALGRITRGRPRRGA
jgi:hypothetical protein